MESVSKKLMKIRVSLTHEEYQYVRQIAMILNAEKNYELKIAKVEPGWKLSIMESERELVSVYSKFQNQAYQILLIWVQNFYAMMNNHPFTTEIYEGDKSFHAKLIRNNKMLNYIGSEKETFWPKLKQESIQNILYRPPIFFALESGNLTPSNTLALEYFLLENYVITLKKKTTNQITNSLLTLENRLEKEMQLNIDLISEKRHPDLRKYLLKQNIRLYIRSNGSLMLQGSLMNIDTGVILASSTSNSLLELLDELEYQLKNNKIRIRKSE